MEGEYDIRVELQTSAIGIDFGMYRPSRPTLMVAIAQRSIDNLAAIGTDWGFFPSCREQEVVPD